MLVVCVLCGCVRAGPRGLQDPHAHLQDHPDAGQLGQFVQETGENEEEEEAPPSTPPPLPIGLNVFPPLSPLLARPPVQLQGNLHVRLLQVLPGGEVHREGQAGTHKIPRLPAWGVWSGGV